MIAKQPLVVIERQTNFPSTVGLSTLTPAKPENPGDRLRADLAVSMLRELADEYGYSAIRLSVTDKETTLVFDRDMSR